MADVAQLERRISELEREVAKLREHIGVDLKANWVDRISGTFKDDPDFAEIIRLGKEYRQSQRPESHG